MALVAAGCEILVSNELMPDRHSLFEHNFPSTAAVTGDIWHQIAEIVKQARERLKGRELDLLYATPPCQGMSKNGRGKLLSAVRSGKKPPFDERNRLILPTLKLASELQPRTILFENVPEMANTVVLDEGGEAFLILDLIQCRLGPEYVGRGEVIEFADYGVPECRQRLITIFSREPTMRRWFESTGTYLPEATHSKSGRGGRQPWVTLRDVISEFPPIDAGERSRAVSEVPFHRVPLLDESKYWWVRHTPPEKSAFDNQCVSCGFSGNPSHVARRGKDGINRTSDATPIRCMKCGAVLPRPSVQREGRHEIMRGFTSAYKRMSYDEPASTLTRNLSYACSDNKLHPEQNRVLSLREAFRVHTIDRFPYEWKRKDGKPVSDKLVREVIGESVPPEGLRVIVEHLVKVRCGSMVPSQAPKFGPLFNARKQESVPLGSGD